MDILDLPLVGGHPALDLVNTLERGDPTPGQDPRDYLDGASSLLAWAGRALLVQEHEVEAVAAAWRHDPGAASAALAATRELREAVHEIVGAATGSVPVGEAARAGALDRLHSRWAVAVGRATLALDLQDGPVVRVVAGSAPGVLVPDRAAEAGLDLLRSSDLAAVKRCPVEDGGCGWMFLDRSRNRSRRWCRMADCGTAVKVLRLTERRRADRAPSSASDLPSN
jgi:predicted RNA-binding Zn ribbon-like protein